MPDQQPQDFNVAGALRTLRIIVAALAMGSVFFLAIALFLDMSSEESASQGPPLITYMACGLALVAFVVRMVVPNAIVTAGLRALAIKAGKQPDAAAVTAGLWALLHTRTIVACALLEGTAFFAIIAYIIEGLPLALLVAGLLILGLALHFPTRSWAEEWIESRRNALQQDRQFGA